MYIDLDLAKKHLNIEKSFTEDDEYILGLIDVAENAVAAHANENLDKLAEAPEPDISEKLRLTAYATLPRPKKNSRSRFIAILNPTLFL